MLVGTFLNLGSPLAAEICGVAGLDWVLVDLEHGTVHEADLLGQLYGGIAGGVPVFVRVESAARERVGRPLDQGAAGVMFPRIDGPREAAEAISHLRYPPEGDRGVATYNRACRFGTYNEEISGANEHVLGIVQIESAESVAAAAEIAALDGVNVLFIGPGDLSHAMGRFGEVEHPDFLAACRSVVGAADAAGATAGILVPDPDRIEWAIGLGFRFIGVGSDSTMLLKAARGAVSAARRVAT